MRAFGLLFISFSLAFSLSAHADLSVEEALVYWSTSSEGALKAPEFQGYKLELDKKTFENSHSASYFVALEHSVKGLPNFRLAYTYLNNKGDATFNFNNTAYFIHGGTMDLSHADITPYYTVLDSVVKLDLGLTVRLFNGEISGLLDDGSGTYYQLQSPIDSIYALIYFNLKVPVGNTGVSFGSTINLGKTNKEQAQDYDIHMHYLSRVGIGLTVGYRYLDAELNSEGEAVGTKVDVDTNFTIHGPYLGLLLRF